MQLEGREVVRLDPLTKAERSERMSRIRNANTQPELAVRRLVYSMGYRYRLRSGSLPGNPDLVFGSRRKVIFVHGCFWHQHGCGVYRMPRTRLGFWEPKLAGNRARDLEVQRQLRVRGWGILVLWECELRDMERVRRRIRRFLGEQ